MKGEKIDLSFSLAVSLISMWDCILTLAVALVPLVAGSGSFGSSSVAESEPIQMFIIKFKWSRQVQVKCGLLFIWLK